MAKKVTVKVYGQKVRVSRQAAKKIRGTQKANRGALYDPSKILGGETLRGAAGQLADLTINPAVHALDRQAASTKANGLALQDRTADYYRQIAAQAQGGLDRATAINNAAQGQIAAAGDQAQARIGTAAQASQNDLSADAQVRGSGLQIGNRAQEELAAMRANSAGATQTAQNLAAVGGASQLNLQNTLAPITQMRGAEQYAQAGNRTAAALNEIGGKRSDVLGTRGGEVTRNLLNLRQQSFENRVVQQNFGADIAKIQADVQKTRINARAKTRLAKMSFRQKMQLQNDAQHAAAKLKKGFTLSASEQKKLKQAQLAGAVDKNGKPKLSPSEHRQRREIINKAGTEVSGAIGQAQRLKREGLGRHQAAGILLSGRESVSRTKRDKQSGTSTTQKIPAVPSYDQLYASIALDMAYDGHVSARNLALARKRYPGLVKSLGLKRAPKRAKSGLQSIAGIGG
jgi:hypothetical protein